MPTRPASTVCSIAQSIIRCPWRARLPCSGEMPRNGRTAPTTVPNWSRTSVRWKRLGNPTRLCGRCVRLLSGGAPADAGFLQDVGGHAELTPRAVGDAFSLCIGLRDLHEILLEPGDVGPAGLHSGQFDLEVPPFLEQ